MNDEIKNPNDNSDLQGGFESELCTGFQEYKGRKPIKHNRPFRIDILENERKSSDND